MYWMVGQSDSWMDIWQCMKLCTLKVNQLEGIFQYCYSAFLYNIVIRDERKLVKCIWNLTSCQSLGHAMGPRIKSTPTHGCFEIAGDPDPTGPTGPTAVKLLRVGATASGPPAWCWGEGERPKVPQPGASGQGTLWFPVKPWCPSSSPSRWEARPEVSPSPPGQAPCSLRSLLFGHYMIASWLICILSYY